MSGTIPSHFLYFPVLMLLPPQNKLMMLILQQ